MGDTSYVPSEEGDNWGDRQPGDRASGLGYRLWAPRNGGWCLRGPTGGGGGEGKGNKGKKRKREIKEGTFQVPSSILFAIREEAENYLRGAIEERDGDEGDDEGAGVMRATTRGTGVTMGVSRARMRPSNPPPRRRGDLRVATRERGPGG